MKKSNVINIECIEDEKKESKLSKYGILITTIILICCYMASLIYGIVAKINENPAVVSPAQAQIVINSAIFGFLCAMVPYFLKWILHIKIGFAINLGIQIIGLAGLVIGEAFQLYYKVFFWDSLLHGLTGAGFAFLGYALCMLVIKDSNLKHKNFIALMVAIMVSLSVALIWEIYEFTCDSIGGLNMQKIMPEDGPLFNGGDTHAPLFGTDQEIAEFYRSPEGFRYALMDTMQDILCCITGIACFSFIAVIITHFNEHAFDNMIQIIPFKGKENIKKLEQQLEE